MKHVLYILPLIILFPILTYGQQYYNHSQYALTSPGAMKYGLYGYDNPAVLTHLESFDLLVSWTDYKAVTDVSSSYGVFAAIPHLGFSFINQKAEGNSVTDYKLSAAVGDPSFSFGLGYGWSAGDISYFNSSDIFTLGMLIRPNRYLSIGLIGNVIPSRDNEGIIEAAVRPFGNEYISLFGDYAFNENNEINKWSAGAAIEAVPGIRITGRYFENEFFSVGLQFNLGRAGFTSSVGFNNDGDHQYNVYGIRVGEFDRNPLDGLSSRNQYVDMNLLGGLKYRRFKLFDDSKTLLDLLRQIEAAKNDDDVSGIALNMSGMNINREMLWELREKLVEFKKSGKKVIVYFDRIGIDAYHFASLADKIIMDPMGELSLRGYLFGRQYYKGTLEKLGIGFTELRYFKYKSASEAFSRTSFSEGEKEQWSAILDDFYALAKNDICAARNISSADYDRLVNEETVFLPEDAVRFNLADTLGRWDMVEDLIAQLEGDKKYLTNPGSLTEFQLPNDNYWGRKPEIAVIYALGVCAMDEGISARTLSKVIEDAGETNNIKAIVFRVDSPGGDGLASDLVAEALKKAASNKPVIVSQGSVAASGGYWISMYGDTILAAPGTLTGSIGVISGWFFNKDMKETLGVSNDYIKRGENADFGFGLRIPFTSLSLPDRDLTEKEKDQFETRIKKLYSQFVNKVTMGRSRSKAEIEAIAEGRVWSGSDGLSNGLVDKLGGLDNAIKIAVEKAGLSNEFYNVTEYPEMPWFNLSSFIPNPFGNIKTVIETESVNDLLFRMQNNGTAMPIVPLDDADFYIGNEP